MLESRQSILDITLRINSKSTDFHGPESQLGDSVLLFLGSKGVGISSIINLLQDKDEVPKSTIALDYNFIRRSGKSLFKDVCHIWELGGGTLFSNLICTPVKSTGSLKRMVVVLMLDLSLPHQLWLTLEHFLSKLSQVLNQFATETKVDEDLINKSWERMGGMEHHQDRSSIQPLPVPLVILGGKYDIYQTFDIEDKKVICQTLRSVAHGHGAMLMYYSLKDQILCKRAKDVLTQLVFALSHSHKHVSQDHTKPLFIPIGADSYQQIGGPPVNSDLLVAMQRWKHNFMSQFPQKDIDSKMILDDPGKDKNYEEPAIDSLRSQKNDEFDKYQWEMERNMRLKNI